MKFKDYKNFSSESVIYGIQNTITKKWYIGSCICFRKRIRSHYYYLRHLNHHSDKLQRSWNKHGEDAFDIQILYHNTSLSTQDLLKLEEKYIKDYNSYYNGYNMTDVCLGVNHFKLTDEQKNKRADISKKPVIAIDRKTNEFLGEYESVTEAARVFKTQTTNISKCCHHRLNYMKGAVFMYKDEYDPNKDYRTEGHGKGVPKSPEHLEKMRHNPNCKVIYKYDEKYNLVKTYYSIAEAERQNGMSKESLRHKLDRIIDGFIYSKLKYEKDIV